MSLLRSITWIVNSFKQKSDFFYSGIIMEWYVPEPKKKDNCLTINGIKNCTRIQVIRDLLVQAPDLLKEMGIEAIYDAFMMPPIPAGPLKNAIIFRIPTPEYAAVLGERKGEPKKVNVAVGRYINFPLDDVFVKKADILIYDDMDLLAGMYNEANNVFILSIAFDWLRPPELIAKLLLKILKGDTSVITRYDVSQILLDIPIKKMLLPKFKTHCKDAKAKIESDGETIKIKCLLEREVDRVLDSSNDEILKLKRKLLMKGTVTFSWDGSKIRVVSSRVYFKDDRRKIWHPNTRRDEVCFGDEKIPEYNAELDVCENAKNLCSFAARVLGLPNIGSAYNDNLKFYLINKGLIEKSIPISFY